MTDNIYILDNGACTAKVGLASMKTPKIVPNCIMKAKSERRRPFIGDQVEDCRDASGLFYILPFQKGDAVNSTTKEQSKNTDALKNDPVRTNEYKNALRNKMTETITNTSQNNEDADVNSMWDAAKSIIIEAANEQIGQKEVQRRITKPKVPCPGCGREFVSLNSHLAKASGPCAEIRSQQFIASLPSISQATETNHVIQTESPSPHDNICLAQNTANSQINHENEAIRKLVQESSTFANTFARFTSFPRTDDNIAHFESVMSNFTKFLVDANNQLPGPAHPSVTYYRKRKEKKAVISNGSYRQSSNPQRSSKRQRDKRNEKYQYDLTQWQYANQRRKVAQTILNSKKPVRMQTQFSQCQRGFVAGLAGTHINASIVDECLKVSKRDKKNCCIVMLDLAKAFDKVGHIHIRHTLESLPVPTDLKNLVVSLATSNSTKIEVNKKSSNSINMLCGVAQGLPLSPTVFNLCQDFILKLITDPSVAAEHGFELAPDLDNLTALAFADDTAVIAKDENSAIVLVESLQSAFTEVGMVINPTKSVAINVRQGKLHSESLSLADGSTIRSISENENIRYLGINFSNGIVFDKKQFLIELESDFRNLVTSPLLRGDQKINILDQYIFPKLVYPLQTTPVDILEHNFLDSVDSIIRQGVREIIGLPADTPIPVYYARRNFRGLGIVRVTWEASLQHLNICQTLLKTPDPHLHVARDCESEIQQCKTHLGITNQETVRAARTSLRDQEFVKWSGMVQRGIGIQWYKSFPLSNQWVSNKQGLTSSDWTNAIKLSMNSMANRGTGGRSRGNRLCRIPICSENNLVETIPHIRGVCPKSELLRNSVHHKIRTATADLFRQKGWEVHEEVHCEALDANGAIQNRRADIIAINRRTNTGMIIDPTLQHIPDREIWDKGGPEYLNQPLNWYTDASKLNGKTGIGVYGPKCKARKALGQHPTVYQGEVYAILFCAQLNLKKGLNKAHINIMSDSQAAVKKL
ncbi:hypothetical protein M8J75_014185 [Diaphorina citri]|nr:hypothetical protein M8J75_014185 [Diaphorina citri]